MESSISVAKLRSKWQKINIEEISKKLPSNCSTLMGSEMTEKDPIDIPKTNGGGGDWRELPRLISSRNQLRTEIVNIETEAFTVEQEICEYRVNEEKILCGTCGLVREPRQRKIAELRLTHQAMIKNKPKHLLCTAGIMYHLETMILEGFLDSGSTMNKVSRCRTCRQENDETMMRNNLVSEFIDILEDQLDNCTNQKNCSMTEACTACFNFMLSQLKNPELFQIQNGKKNDPINHAENSTADHSNVISKDKTPQNCSDQDNQNSGVTPSKPKDDSPQNHDEDNRMHIDAELKKDESQLKIAVAEHPTNPNDISVPIPDHVDVTTPVIDQDDCTQHTDVASDKSQSFEQEINVKHSNIATKFEDEIAPIPDQDNIQHNNIATKPTNIPNNCEQENVKHSNVATKPEDEIAPIPDQDNIQHIATKPANIPKCEQQNVKHSTEPKDETTLNQDVPINVLTETKKILSPDCELHSHIDPATILFKNVFTKQLQSLTAELDKLYVEQINQQENQKDLVTEITLLKVKLQDRVKSETMDTELEKIKKEIVSEMNQLKDQFAMSEFTVHSELKMQQNSHEKLACKMDQLKWDLSQQVTPEKLKSELEIHRKRHDKLIAKIDGLKEKMQGYVQTEEIQATLDKQTKIQKDLTAQWNNYFTKHGKECVTLKTMQAELTKQIQGFKNDFAQWKNYIGFCGKDWVTTKTMQLELSKHEKMQKELLDKLIGMQIQLTKIQDHQVNLQSTLCNDRNDQAKKISDLKAHVARLTAKLVSVNAGSQGHNQVPSAPNPYRMDRHRPYNDPRH